MLRLWQEVRRVDRAAPVYVRQASFGSLRLAACGGYADAGKPEEPSAHAVALRGSSAERSSSLPRRRHDGLGPCGAARRVNTLWTWGLATPLRQGRRLESYRLLQSSRDDRRGLAREATRRKSLGRSHGW